MKKELCELLEIGDKSYYVWKNKSHKKLIKLIEKYFTKFDIKEFIISDKVTRLEITNKFLPVINGIKALVEIDKLKEIDEYENEIKGKHGVLADFINYMYKFENKYQEDYESIKYYYIKDDTFAQTIDKIALLNNKIDLNIIIYFCTDIEHDLLETIYTLKNYNKGEIYSLVTELLAPLMDMVHNNTVRFYYESFDKILCKNHKIDFIEFENNEMSFQKKIILESIDEFILKVKKNDV